MTAPTIPKRVGHPGTVPWESLPSLRVGLPRDRAEWLALVLPIISRCKSHPEVARELTGMGHAVTQSTVMLWHRKLSAYQGAGALPEHPEALPVRVAGWREGMPLPSASQAAEGGRRAAVTRWGGKKGKGARKGPGKSGKGKP